MTQNTALAFPATAVDAIRFSELHRRQGWRVIGGASVPPGGAEAAYDAWVQIPFIYEPGFADALGEIVAREHVTRVFSSHEVVSRHLKRLLPELCPQVAFETVERGQRDGGFLNLVAESRTAYGALASDIGGADRLTELEQLAVLTTAFQFRGESGVHKLTGMMAAMGACPQGDVVEIGVLAGRSAYVLSWLARRYGIGAVLCVDPWSNEGALQQDAPALLREASAEVDFADVFREFRLNLIPSFWQSLNYVREPATSLRERYHAGLRVGPTEFGTTSYTGAIAFLHIDGNHDFSAVSKDVGLWWHLVLPGGWIVVDDYVWPFGDGPRRAADMLMAENPHAFARAFVLEGALFLQRSPC
jgi:hypothetical protein